MVRVRGGGGGGLVVVVGGKSGRILTGNKKASFLDRRKHQSKPNTKGERQRMHLSQTRGDDAGRRADIAHASAFTVVRTRARVRAVRASGAPARHRDASALRF